jgi:hypothetical protein
MANPVFDRALANLKDVFASVEAETNRLAGVQQHIDALKIQEKQLQATVTGLAEQVASARSIISAAHAIAQNLPAGKL